MGGALSPAHGWQLTGGAHVGATPVHRDERGAFQEVFRASAGAAGVQPFTVRQVSRTLNRCGVLRGLHLTDTPPGQAKYVMCVSGRIRDVVVDVRVGSPTFGEHIAVTLSPEEGLGVFIAQGMAHGYVALAEGTVVLYLHDAEYAPERDRELQALDPGLGIDWPPASLRSPKDVAAPTLASALAAGVLPSFERCYGGAR